MTKIYEIYKCSVCGNVVEVLADGAGELVCCGQPMTLLEEQNYESEFGEKHIPLVIKNDDSSCDVKIGSYPHPMSEEHHIVFAEVFNENGRCIKYLDINQEPVVKFNCDNITYAREYCNIHGLWSNKS